jgi:hypothetical protein
MIKRAYRSAMETVLLGLSAHRTNSSDLLTWVKARTAFLVVPGAIQSVNYDAAMQKWSRMGRVVNDRFE